MIITCTIGQIAIFVKKFIEHRKDRIRVALINPNLEKNEKNGDNSSVSNSMGANNKRWNDYLCNNTGFFAILFLVAFLVCFWHFGLDQYLLTKNLDEEDKRLLKYHFINYLIINVVIPASIYAKNDKLFNHVKTEILEFV